jgi:hypothetical protein
MTDDRLLDRLRSMDPATPERIAEASVGTDDVRRSIESEMVDELAGRRRERRRRVGVAIAAAVVTAALLVPLILLLPLGEDDPVVGATPSTGPTPTATTSDDPSPADPGPRGPIEVAAPAPGDTVTSPVTISGTADVFEATVSIRIVDSVNNVIAETFTTASCGTGCRGDYSIDVPYSVNTDQPGTIQVFEVSAEDGRRVNMVRVPVTLTPGPEDPVATAVTGDWTAPDGSIAPNGTGGDGHLVMHSYEGAEHCGWTSATFLSLGWPVGTESANWNGARQYVRDPQGIFSSSVAGSFDGDATLPDDAANTGYHRGDWQLWIAPSDADRVVYLMNADPTAQTDPAAPVVERWARAVDVIACD